MGTSLNEFALSAGVTKMDFEEGKLNGIHSHMEAHLRTLKERL